MGINKDRITYLDNLCGLLMINMVFFVHIRMHADVTAGIIPFINRLLCFFMPWFFYKSGMLYHDEDWKNRIKKDFRSLILPYLYFTVFGWIVYACSSLMTGKISLEHLVVTPVKDIFCSEAILWNGPLWFLPSLFVVKWLACVLFKRLNVWVVLSVSVLIAALFHYTGYVYPVYLGNILLGLSFYSLGKLMKEIQYERWVFIFAFVLFVIAVSIPVVSNYFDFRYNTVDEGDNYFLVLVYCVAGIVLFNNIFKRYIDREIPVLSSLGRNSIIILCVHYPLVKLFTGILDRIHPFSPVQMWIILTVLMIPVLWLFVWLVNKKAAFLIGKKS